MTANSHDTDNAAPESNPPEMETSAGQGTGPSSHQAAVDGADTEGADVEGSGRAEAGITSAAVDSPEAGGASKTGGSPASDSAPAGPIADGGWDGTKASLRERYPNATEAILFSVYKLQQDAELTMKDFRDEARLYGITMSGRAFHSAKVLLGMAEKSVRRTKEKAVETPAPRAFSPAPQPMEPATDVESSLIQAVQQIQDAATADARRLRDAMRKAVDVLQRALDGRDL